MKGIGYRTLKTAVGAGLALWIADLLNIEFATFTAIIVIMCIERTKKKTLLTMKDKLFASLLSLFLGALFFELFGYHPISFGVFIVLFVPLLIFLHIQNGFITSMVVLTHVYLYENASWDLFLNEFYIIGIGMGIALVVNSFMPSFKQDIEAFKKLIEEKFEKILYEFSAHLRDSNRNWDGKEILEAEDLINEAKSIAILDVENHLLRKKNKDYYYLAMREDQLELLKHMMKIVAIAASLDLNIKQKEMFASFLENLSKNVHSGDTTDESLQQLRKLYAEIKKTDLPKTREEFEVRANLFYLIFEMENYLTIKKELFSNKQLHRK